MISYHIKLYYIILCYIIWYYIILDDEYINMFCIVSLSLSVYSMSGYWNNSIHTVQTSPRPLCIQHLFSLHLLRQRHSHGLRGRAVRHGGHGPGSGHGAAPQEAEAAGEDLVLLGAIVQPLKGEINGHGQQKMGGGGWNIIQLYPAHDVDVWLIPSGNLT